MGRWQGLRAVVSGAAAAAGLRPEGRGLAAAAVAAGEQRECCWLGGLWAAMLGLRARAWGGREAAGDGLREGSGLLAARAAGLRPEGRGLAEALSLQAAVPGGRKPAGAALREGSGLIVAAGAAGLRPEGRGLVAAAAAAGEQRECCWLGGLWAAILGLRAAVPGGRPAAGAGVREGSGLTVAAGAALMTLRAGAVWACLLLLVAAGRLFGAEPVFGVEKIFAPESWHNHSSSVVELPNGDLFVVWFHGSGERQSDDVKIEGARWRKATGTWSARFDVADTPGFPDTNCVVYLDSQKRLWLLWPVILANTWESALMKYRISTDYQQAEGPPVWGFADNLLVIPTRMAERTKEVMQRDLTRPGPFGDWARRSIGLAEDKLFSRLGWFTRTHPIELPSGRMLVPLYSDGFSFGLMAISDDKGKTWKGSEPIVGFGNIQPSVVRRQNGELVAYMRDNGPAPKRIMMSVSKDDGMSWSPAADTELFNPGASVEAIRLRDGKWLLVYNDLERGRGSLAASLSDDEGKTWKWTRHIATGPGQYHYPSVIQGADGMIHVTYSQHEREGEKNSKTIAHARFNVDWVMGK